MKLKSSLDIANLMGAAAHKKIQPKKDPASDMDEDDLPAPKIKKVSDKPKGFPVKKK